MDIRLEFHFWFRVEMLLKYIFNRYSMSQLRPLCTTDLIRVFNMFAFRCILVVFNSVFTVFQSSNCVRITSDEYVFPPSVVYLPADFFCSVCDRHIESFVRSVGVVP
jgi:hypothetical protein